MIQQYPLKRKAILVVDDVEMNRTVLNLALRSTYDIKFAINGQDALDRLNQNAYDLVILDIRMPVLDGIETLKIIRQTADLANLPVILASALDDYATIVEGLELGANDYITKPIDVNILRARVKTQITLKQIMDERNEALQLLERMMDIASHDLKNPLANLSIIISLLKGGQIENGTPHNFLDMASESISTMMDIIQGFLGSSSIARGYTAFRSTELAGHDLLNSTINQYHVSANTKHITLIKEHIEEATIIADPVRIGQVISNLVSNAIKYSPCHGTVYIRAYHTNSMWRVEVQDTGAGISEDERQYLFQAFTKNQITTTPTNGESSTGLGLWIASEMMRIQQGTIGMDTPTTGGCCFWIEIPTVRVENIVR